MKRGRREEVPVCCYDGIAFDVEAFGFGFLADAGTGGFIFLFLEWTCHILGEFGRCNICKCREGDEFGNSENWIDMDKPRRYVRGDNSVALGFGA